MPDKATAEAAGDEDRLSALPDDVLLLVLSSLPSDDAVRTSMLARRWRHLWRSTRVVRIDRRPIDCGWCAGSSRWTPWTLNAFVNRLLLLRGGAPLDEFEIACGEISGGGMEETTNNEVEHDRRTRERNKELSRYAGTWIQHVLSFCQTRVLRLSVRTSRRRLQITDVFVSHFLTTVDLSDATLKFGSLDFSRCPALEDLFLMCCRVHVERILSRSLRRLNITECDFHQDTRCRISAPCLVSLQLAVYSGRAPLLESMPLLVTANVRLQDYMCDDICEHNNYYGECADGKCRGCRGSSGDGRSVLLTDIELTSYPNVFIFGKDLKFCATFSRLKTLLLNEWCMKPDFGSLAYFLQHSPVLENLTIQLEDCFVQPRHDIIEIDENYNPTEHFFVSKQLKTVKIKWHRKNKLVVKIVMVLRTYGVPLEQINIEEAFDPPKEYSCGTEFVNSDGGDFWW